jgi:hypothetical protein
MDMEDSVTVCFSDRVNLISDTNSIQNDDSVVVQCLGDSGQFVAYPTALSSAVEQFAIILHGSAFMLDFDCESSDHVLRLDGMNSEPLYEVRTESAFAGRHTTRQQNNLLCQF